MTKVTPLRAPHLDAHNIASAQLFRTRWENRENALRDCIEHLAHHHDMTEEARRRLHPRGGHRRDPAPGSAAGREAQPSQGVRHRRAQGAQGTVKGAAEMTAANAIDPRDYAIIRALGALCLATPNVELARAFLRDAGAGERIHHAAQVQRSQQALAQGKARRVSDQTIESCRLASVFEELLQEDARQ